MDAFLKKFKITGQPTLLVGVAIRFRTRNLKIIAVLIEIDPIKNLVKRHFYGCGKSTKILLER
jgi:hypothetical protein